MKCPACGAAELIHETRDLPFTYRGFRTLIHGVTGDYCLSCGEGVLDTDEGDRYAAQIRAFIDQTKAA
ncbi:type II toxin-antitoxin system MqsA family antitoxin [Pseudoduganella namucuonensis]|uniref:type II toxin-antitoxin system MqsA family antitoxin n=1 Tax=Pseudoduganella namucuonensis TaxID=1035707 RepID=UPI000B886C26|nr:type II toxin-antitoxin system MqsA family antitoxin [Pseudoduganella namucuonensis]